MKLVKKTAEYTIYQKRNKRYSVKGANKKAINSDDKVKILLAEELIKITAAAPAKPEATEEAAAEESTDAAEGTSKV